VVATLTTLVVVAGGVSCGGSSGGGSAAGSTTNPSPGQAPATAAQSSSATAGGTDSASVYAGIRPTDLRPEFAAAVLRVFVPNGLSQTVSVIDPVAGKVVNTISTGVEPQHVVPTWDLKKVWVLDNQSNDLIQIDPVTGTAGPKVPVDDPYNLYFTPDGSDAIVVAEKRQRLDFRDPVTMALRSSLSVNGCKGINHADYSADFSYMLVTCEFAGAVAKIDMRNRTVAGFLLFAGQQAQPGQPPQMGLGSMPQDCRLGPDGKHFYVADMMAGGVHVLDGDSLTQVAFIPTGIGAHGITPSRDGKNLFVANRGSESTSAAPHGPGSVSVLDTTTNTVTATWPIPNGGSPDMGNLSVDGKVLWLSGRFDSEVYAIDTGTGALVHRIKVDNGPHGLTVWPQPGKFSLGHTGNTR
jgi:YVTN family beta-propeller protein